MTKNTTHGFLLGLFIMLHNCKYHCQRTQRYQYFNWCSLSAKSVATAENVSHYHRTKADRTVCVCSVCHSSTVCCWQRLLFASHTSSSASVMTSETVGTIVPTMYTAVQIVTSYGQLDFTARLLGSQKIWGMTSVIWCSKLNCFTCSVHCSSKVKRQRSPDTSQMTNNN